MSVAIPTKRYNVCRKKNCRNTADARWRIWIRDFSMPIYASPHFACVFMVQHTVVWNKQELRRKYWATRSSFRLFACTAHSFACSALFASLARSAALTHWLTPELVGKWKIRWLILLCFFMLWTIVKMGMMKKWQALCLCLFLLVLGQRKPIKCRLSGKQNDYRGQKE